MSRKINPCELAYHPLHTVHQPCELVYMDLLGPVTGIIYEYRYVLTAIDGFSRLLAMRPIHDQQTSTVVNAIQVGVKLIFIPAMEHQQNLVERAHRTLWSTLQAIRVTNSIDTW